MIKMGFGRSLNTDFVHELQGLVPTSDYYERFVFRGSRWRALPIISLSIGQGELGVTPLQLANHAAMIANRGHYYIPHVVKNIEGNQIDLRFRQPIFAGIDRHHYDDVVEGMALTMQPGGTGARSAIPGITYCGKTGTVQNPHGANHSVFLAFAPKDNPEIAISVYIENGMGGATFAAPIASLVIEKYLTGSISEGRKWLENNMLRANLMDPLRMVMNDGTEE
jgi:penicillin-binding protein 2